MSEVPVTLSWISGASPWGSSSLALLRFAGTDPGEGLARERAERITDILAEIGPLFPGVPVPGTPGIPQLARYLADAFQPPSQRALYTVRLHESGDETFVTIPAEGARAGVRLARSLCRLLARLLRVRDPDRRARAIERTRAVFQETMLADRGAFVQAQLIGEARRIGLPVQRLPARTVLFGEGCRRRILFRLFSDRTSHYATLLTTDKVRTREQLAAAGLPVPVQRVAHDAGSAVRAAREIGFPVVVKPRSADLGRGVAVGLASERAVARAFAAARRYSKLVLVESVLPGKDYRFMVFGDRLVAGLRRDPASVIGDGKHTIAELIEITNQDPRRTAAPDTPLYPIRVRDATVRLLARSSLGLSSIPEVEQVVVLETASNVSLGGTAEYILPVAHPDNGQLALDAARLLDVDIAGVDILLPDVARSWRETGGGICEVNVTPGMQHDICRDPAASAFPGVPAALFEFYFPPGTPRRIPIAVFLEGPGQAELARGVHDSLVARSWRIGHGSPARLRAGGSLDLATDGSHPDQCRRLLRDVRLDAILVEVDPEAASRRGLGLERADLLVVPRGAPTTPAIDWLRRLVPRVLESGDGAIDPVTEITDLFLGLRDSAT